MMDIVTKVVRTGKITSEELNAASNEELVELLTTLPGIIEVCNEADEVLNEVKKHVLNKLNSVK